MKYYQKVVKYLYQKFPFQGLPIKTKFGVLVRVARWFIFKPKIPIWVNFGMHYIGSCWYILRPSVIFNVHLGYSMYDHLVHFELFWCIFSDFGYTYQEKSGNPGFGMQLCMYTISQPWYRVSLRKVATFANDSNFIIRLNEYFFQTKILTNSNL
jgi:hypothetical protein